MEDRFGRYGGQYVPEIVMPALKETENAYEALREDREVERFMDVRDDEGNLFHIDFMESRLIKNGQVLTEGGQALKNELADFIGCVKNGNTPLVTAREATNILGLCLDLEKGMSVDAPFLHHDFLR